MSSSTTDTAEINPVLSTSAIIPTSLGLNQRVRNLRFVKDRHGNLWCTLTVTVDPSTGQVLGVATPLIRGDQNVTAAQDPATKALMMKNVDTQWFKVGSYESTVATGIKHLATYTTADTDYMSFESPSGIDYQVATGKTFYITRLTIRASAAIILTFIGYGDTGVNDGLTAPTNCVAMSYNAYMATSANTTYQFNCFIPIPAGKFPCIRQGGAGNLSVIAEGVEA